MGSAFRPHLRQGPSTMRYSAWDCHRIPAIAYALCTAACGFRRQSDPVEAYAAAVEATSGPASVKVSDGYFVLHDGARLYYRTLGEGGDTVLVLHGGPGANLHGLFEDFRPLAVNRTLIFYDQRGGGRSGPIPDVNVLTASLHVSDLDEVRQQLALDKLVLVGHS